MASLDVSYRDISGSNSPSLTVAPVKLSKKTDEGIASFSWLDSRHYSPVERQAERICKKANFSAH